jgi:asparagine synthase (glutamine-hydrolysing)
MPVFPKRRFQHGALPAETLQLRIGQDENGYRRTFDSLYSTVSSTTGSAASVAQ